MTRKELDEMLDERGEQAIVLDDFDDAIEGYVEVASRIRVVYDYEKCIDVLRQADDMTEEDARDTFEYNTVRALPHMGVLHPLLIHKAWPV